MRLSDWSFILELYQLNGALLAFFQIIISIIIIIIIILDIAYIAYMPISVDVFDILIL